jgi:GT2 family glycosyltransferase
MRVSIVVPTYKREARLNATLEHLLRSECAGLQAIEIIVVDDGSPLPASRFVPREVAPPFSLRVLRQENAGPARARNNGFRVATGRLVVFIDDDILAPPTLVRSHLEAHAARPGSVVFGRCPYPEEEEPSPLRRYVESLGNDPGRNRPEELVPASVLASGQISVEREVFEAEAAVYREDLANPAAEEFELAWRLRRRGVPILLAPRVVAVHDQPVTLDAICRQQYKYGLGCAETWAKCPETRDMPELRLVLATNGPVRRGDSLAIAVRKGLRTLAASRPARRALTSLAGALEKIAPEAKVLERTYTMAIGSHFVAGIHAGLREYDSVSAR